MTIETKVLTCCILGYHKKQVDEYLEKINYLQTNKINSLHKEIEAFNNEKELLIKEYAQLENEKQELFNNKELLKLADKRAGKIVSQMQNFAEKEIETIIMEAEKRVTLLEKQREEIIHKKNQLKKEIGLLLHKITSLSLEQEESRIDQNINELEKEINNTRVSMGKSINSTLEKIMGQLKRNKAFENFHKQENAQTLNKKMTADGTMLVELSQNEIKQPEEDYSSFADGKKRIALLKEEGTQAKKVQDNKAFWEEWGEVPDSLEMKSPVTDNVVIFDVKNKKGNEVDLPVPEEKSITMKRVELETAVAETPNDRSESEPKMEKMSAGVAQDINNIRQRYIVGKISGIDLFDQKGNLIIAKNSVITADVVTKAEVDGKLAELIVNMTMPDLEE